MAEEPTPPRPTRSSSIKDVASLLREYVPKSEHGEALDAINEMTAEITRLKAIVDKHPPNVDKLVARNAELEGKVRDRNYRDAYQKLVGDLRINPDFADEVFELAKLTLDKDEPDLKAMKGVLKDFLELKPKFKLADQAEAEGEPAQAEAEGPGVIDRRPPYKLRLETEEEGRGAPLKSPNKLRYRGSDLSNPEWMQQNATAYAKAAAEGRLVRVGD